MQLFREKHTTLILTLITGIIFLNMSFFLLEVKLLGLHKDHQLMQNIANMIAGAAFEEERDCPVQAPSLGEEEYVGGHHTANHAGCYFLIAEYSSHLFNDGASEHGYLKKFSPPPEI